MTPLNSDEHEIHKDFPSPWNFEHGARILGFRASATGNTLQESGKLKIGDFICAVNGISVENRPFNFVISLLTKVCKFLFEISFRNS